MFKHDHTVYADLSGDLRDGKSDWNVAALRSFDYPQNLTSVAVEPIAGLLAIGTAIGTIHIFGGVSVETKLLLPDAVKVKFLQFSSSTFQIVCLDERSQLHIWDLSSFGRPKLAASARFDHATSLTLSPSHSHAFIALESGEIRTYDLLCLRKSSYRIPNMWHLYEEKTMANRMDKPDPTTQLPLETVIHPRDLNLLFVAYSGGIILSDLTQRNTLRAYEFVLPAGAPGGSGYGHPDILTHRHPAVTAVAIHPAGHFFAAGYSDGCIAFWAVEDEDQPLLVRTLDATRVNSVNVEELDKSHETPPQEREPIYKLAWSSFSNSSDPRGGQTALTILGGQVMAEGETTGLNVQWLPAFNPAEPPNPTGTQTSLHPFVRSAMQASLVPISDFFYYTPGVAQDFFLMPRNSPHFAGHYDPTAILISVESVGEARIVEAYQFPPPAFTISSEFPAEEIPESGSLEDDLASTLKSMTVNDDPRMLRLPTSLSFGSTGVFGAQLFTLDRDSHETLVGESTDAFTLSLKGGAAWSDESKAREIRLAKFQSPRILMTRHRNLAAALQFHDISAQLLITSDSAPIGNHFPKPLPGLTIDLRPLLTDATVVKKTSPSFLERAVVQAAYFARQSLECVLQFASGEVVVYRLKSGSSNPPKFTESSDDELIPLGHVLTLDESRYSPYFLLTGKPVSACAISDIGFLAVAYTDSLVVVDMRGPRLMLRRGRDKKKDRMSLLHSSEAVNTITSLTWTVATTENDPQLRIRLVIAYTSGISEVLTILRDTNSSSWHVDAEIKKAETVAYPLAGGTFIVDSKSGVFLRAFKENLAQSFHPTPAETHCILVATGVKGAKCFADINGTRLGKTDWGNKTGSVRSTQIVEKMGSHALVASTDHAEILAFSLPQLEPLCTLKLPVEDVTSLTCDDTGDWMSITMNTASGTIDHASYGTVFDFRRAYTPPDTDLLITKPIVPAQPQPVSLGPTSLLSSWFRFGQSMTGEQLDILLGGPDRPIPETTQRTPANPATASSVAQTAAGTQSSLYARLQSAVGERGQMLGDLEDRFNSLEEGSRSMVAQAKRLAAQQSAKSWFGI
ncbi:WD40 containing snare-dependent exocytosis protein [Mycena crocata]|nr:WD40 containing snare-dependent exocytosis protein [Mycena crocata]